MAPVVAVLALPCGDPVADGGTCDGVGELLRAGKGRHRADQHGARLDDACARVGAHCVAKAREARAGHHAVSVEHDHVRVAAAPAAHEIADVAGLAVLVLGTAAVPDLDRCAEIAELRQPALLGDPDLGVRGVGQDEDLEGFGCGRRQVARHRGERREDGARVLVVDRHDERGQLVAPIGGGFGPFRTEGEDEADQCVRRAERDPRERDGEDRDQNPFEHGDAARARGNAHLVGCERRQEHGEDSHRRPRSHRPEGDGAREFRCRRSFEQGLLRHLARSGRRYEG